MRRWLILGLAVMVGLTISTAAPWSPGRVDAAATPVASDFPPFPDLPPLPDVPPRAAGPLNVVASTSILADLARQVGGARVEARSILPANADPHDFEPRPTDLVHVEAADVIVLHGLHLDAWAASLVQNVRPDVLVVVATEGITTLASDEAEFSEGDPHVWFDPTRVKTMVSNIAAGLAAADPEGATHYEARAAAYQDALDVLDEAIKERIALIPPERRKLVTNHDALRYYADRYGLEIVGTVIPGIDARTEPSAKEVAELIEIIEREGVSVIFSENTVNPALARALAEQVGIRVVAELYTDSLGEAGSGADTYIGLMQTDTRIIVEALRSEG